MGIRTAAMRSFACIGAVLVLACGGGGTSGGGQPQPTTASVTVVNNTSLPITEVYISPSSSSTWGPNQISSPIPAGGSRTINSIPPDTYDLKAVTQDGAYTTSMGHALTAGGTYTFTVTQTVTMSLVVHNTSSYTVSYLYVTPTPNGSNGSWGVNQLGSYTIAPGATFTLTNIPVGTYDVKAWSTGQTVSWTHYGYYFPAGGFTWTLY